MALPPLNRVEVTFPTATGWIQVKNIGTSGIKLTFKQSGNELLVMPGERAPVQGDSLWDVRMGPFCTGSPETIPCAVVTCSEPVCAWCGRHMADHDAAAD